MNEWLRLMLEEIRRKKEQGDEDRAENRRRADEVRRRERSRHEPGSGDGRSRT